MKTRRQFIQNGLAATAVAPFLSQAGEPTFGEWQALFDGETLDGWKAVPRIGVHKLLRSPEGKSVTKANAAEITAQWNRENGTPQAVFDHTGDWRVVDGAIVGGQKPAGSRHGAYLITEEEFGDIELEYEIKPDWQTDTGVLVRQHPVGTIGFQILCDHRPNGGIGGFYTNGLGSYIAAPFVVAGDKGEDFRVENFREGKKDTRFAQGNVADAATFEQFREVWNLNEWNRFRARIIGAEPTITVWINGLKIGSVDTANPGTPNYDASQIQRLVGTKGHIGLEVHSNGPNSGWMQWAKGAVCCWKNIRVREVVS